MPVLIEIVLVSGLLTDYLALVGAAWLTGRASGALTADALGLFTFLLLSTALIVGLVAGLQLLRGPDAPPLRLFPARGAWRRSLILAAVTLPGLLLLTAGLRGAAQLIWPELAAMDNPVLGLVRTPQDLALFVIGGIVGGGLREEVQRAFMIQRSTLYLGSPWPGLIVWSVVFGILHQSQGPDAMVVTAILGLAFGLLYLRGGNLMCPFLTHAAFNCTVLAIYWHVGP